MVQLQATNVSTLATGVYPVVLTIVKHATDGTGTRTYDGELALINNSSSPYGAGWSIGGLQQITVAVPDLPLMISDGSGTGESSPPPTASTTPASRSTPQAWSTIQRLAHYTRTYTDGTVVTFNSSGQETSSADRNGNTTSYAYVTSGRRCRGLADDHRSGRARHDAQLTTATGQLSTSPIRPAASRPSRFRATTWRRSSTPTARSPRTAITQAPR